MESSFALYVLAVSHAANPNPSGAEPASCEPAEIDYASIGGKAERG
jgi:hypothetical protein